MATIMDLPKSEIKRPRLSNYDYESQSNRRNFKRRNSMPSSKKDDEDDIPKTKYDLMSESERSREIERCEKGIYQFNIFTKKECQILENMIDEVVQKARNNEYKKYTVDTTPLRTKYFFGEGYTYGGQMIKPGPNQERLYAKGDVDDIPKWVNDLVIDPLLKSGRLDQYLPTNKENFFNSVVINDYSKGGCIAPHIDPIHIFCRPLVTISLSSDSYLSFGCRFVYKPMRASRPLIRLPLDSGVITVLSGYAADNITHCVCPDDVTNRRTVIILRRVCDDAPRLPPYQENIHASPKDQNTNFSNRDSTVNRENRHTRRLKEFHNNSQKKLTVRSSKLKSHRSSKSYDVENKKKFRADSILGRHTNELLNNKYKKSRQSSREIASDKKSSHRQKILTDFSDDPAKYKYPSGITDHADVSSSLRKHKQKLEALRCGGQSDDDEDKTVVVKRKKKMFRVKV